MRRIDQALYCTEGFRGKNIENMIYKEYSEKYREDIHTFEVIPVEFR